MLGIAYHDAGPDDYGRRTFTLYSFQDHRGQVYFAVPSAFDWWPKAEEVNEAAIKADMAAFPRGPIGWSEVTA